MQSTHVSGGSRAMRAARLGLRSRWRMGGSAASSACMPCATPSAMRTLSASARRGAALRTCRVSTELGDRGLVRARLLCAQRPARCGAALRTCRVSPELGDRGLVKAHLLCAQRPARCSAALHACSISEGHRWLTGKREPYAVQLCLENPCACLPPCRRLPCSQVLSEPPGRYSHSSQQCIPIILGYSGTRTHLPPCRRLPCSQVLSEPHGRYSHSSQQCNPIN